MSAALSLVFIVGAAYLAAHLVFDWLARRFRIVSGAEYLILGILLGPQVSGFMSASVVQSFAPFMTLALGWAAAALGMNFFLPRMIKVSGETWQVALLEASLTFVFVSAVMLLGFAWAFEMNYHQVLLPAVALGAIATATASSGVTAYSESAPHPVITQLETSALVDGVIAIVSFGLLLCIVHIDVNIGARALTATEWVAITIGIGVISGTLFHLFIGSEHDVDRLFIAMAGAIILASGAAAYLRLSPLLPCLIIGMVLVNTARNRSELTRLMTAVEKPLYFVLLIFAGASWRPSRYDWMLPVLLYMLVRVVAKLGSARLASRTASSRELYQANWGRGLLGQGTIALAIAMSYSLNDTTVVPNVVFTATVLSVVMTDLFGVRLVELLVKEDER